MLWTDTELGPLFAYLKDKIPKYTSNLEQFEDLKETLKAFFNAEGNKDCNTQDTQEVAAINLVKKFLYFTQLKDKYNLPEFIGGEISNPEQTHLIEFFKARERATCNLKSVDADPARLYDNASQHVNQYGPLVNTQRRFTRNSKTSWNVTFSAVKLFDGYTENKELYSGYGFTVTKSDDAKNSLRVGDVVIQVGDTNVTEHTTLKEVTEALSIVAIVPPLPKKKGGSKKKRRTRKKKKKKRRTRNKSISILK
jgi:hypothetical protein